MNVVGRPARRTQEVDCTDGTNQERPQIAQIHGALITKPGTPERFALPCLKLAAALTRSVAAATFFVYLGNPFPRFLRSCFPDSEVPVVTLADSTSARCASS
jgi:hypothetical protein